ncbi:hypothetical protein A3Q56_03082 [Intoshia linei]|uniref:Apyrase n=1 Tax=Intoshia linei TaxID=1819745 RepID=A0A177B4E0_9BILA|nr:hypothetical protein A3Q56_03082 [Intoshia linei]
MGTKVSKVIIEDKKTPVKPVPKKSQEPEKNIVETIQFDLKLILMIVVFVILIILLIIFFALYLSQLMKNSSSNSAYNYNETYPLTNYLQDQLDSYADIIDVKVLLLSNEQRRKNRTSMEMKWGSTLKTVHLNMSRDYTVSRPTASLSVNLDLIRNVDIWNDNFMKLMDIVVYNGEMISLNTKFNLIYNLDVLAKSAQPRFFYQDIGNAFDSIKIEWITTKDEFLYMGGTGSTYDTNGNASIDLNYHVYVFDSANKKEILSWKDKYQFLQQQTEFDVPGYISHEAVAWDSCKKRWCFLPRRASKLQYEKSRDRQSATNLLLCMNDDMSDFTKTEIGAIEYTRGFSAFRFVPNTNCELIVAIKTEHFGIDENAKTESYFWLFDIFGSVYVNNLFIDKTIYTGLEFL